MNFLCYTLPDVLPQALSGEIEFRATWWTGGWAASNSASKMFLLPPGWDIDSSSNPPGPAPTDLSSGVDILWPMADGIGGPLGFDIPFNHDPNMCSVSTPFTISKSTLVRALYEDNPSNTNMKRMCIAFVSNEGGKGRYHDVLKLNIQ